jgi:branched-chain amino acid transport system substrate-binding protein
MRGLALFSLLMLAAGAFSTAQEPPPYQIDSILSLTGSGAFNGKTESQALGVLESFVNGTGGISGRPIKIAVVDDQTNPAVAVQLANELIAKHATVILGPAFTATCSAVAPLVTAGPLTYCLSPGVHPAPGSFMFSANPSTSSIVNSEIRYVRARGWTRVAFMLSTDATGQDLWEQYESVLALPEYKTLQTVAKQVFNPTDLSVSAQLASIKNAQPQVLFTGVSGTAFGTVLRGLHEAGLDVPVIAPSSNMHLDQMAQYNGILPATLLIGSSRGAVIEPNADPRVKQAQTAFFAAMKRAGITPSNANVVWDAVTIVVDALRHLGTNVTAAQLRDYIGGLQNWTGIDGPYDFRRFPQRGIGDDGSIMYTWSPAKSEFTLASKPQGRL